MKILRLREGSGRRYGVGGRELCCFRESFVVKGREAAVSRIDLGITVYGDWYGFQVGIKSTVPCGSLQYVLHLSMTSPSHHAKVQTSWYEGWDQKLWNCASQATYWHSDGLR
jgi:hypothetical protein